MLFDLTSPSRRAASVLAATASTLLMSAPGGLRAQGASVAQVEVLPPTVSLGVGQRTGVLATAYDARGQVIPTVRIAWSSTNPNIARVEQDAREPGVATVIGVAAGVASIEAAAGDRKGTVAVQVTGGGAVAPVPVPGQGMTPVISNAAALRIEPNALFLLPSEDIRLTLTFLQADGSPANPAPVTWRSFNDAVASVDGQGSVVGISAGQGVVEARAANDLVARATVQVASAPFAFASPVVSLSPTQDDTIRVVVPQQGNRRVASRWLTWTTSDPNIVTVSPNGVVTGISAGRAEVLASGFGQAGRVEVVVHRVVEELRLSPPPSAGAVTVPLSAATRFTAEALDSAGQAVTEAPLVWQVADTSVLTFDRQSMTGTGKKIGRTTVQVRGPGRGLQATWTVEVVAGGLVFRPARLGLGINERQTVEVNFTDDRGVPLAPASGIQWRSLNPTVAQVDQQGTIMGLAYGHAPIVASTTWGRSDTVPVYVQAGLLVSSTRNGTTDLYALDLPAFTQANRLTRDSLHGEFEGAFSPDGSRIVFVSDRDGNPELYIMNADGSAVTRLSDTPATEGSPAWSPDGRQIVYASNSTGNFQVWIMNLDGSDRRSLTAEPSSNFQPTVSPDGRLVAFTSDRAGNYDVWVMGLDGSAPRNVTNTSGSETAPAWFPDGQLAYVVQQAEGRGATTTRVMKLDLGSGAASPITASGLTGMDNSGTSIMDIEVSPDGGALAMVVTAFESRGGVTQRLFLMPLDQAGAPPVQVPAASSTDRIGSPSFRR